MRRSFHPPHPFDGKTAQAAIQQICLRVRPLAHCAPVPLAGMHQLNGFHCTEPALEVWLKQRARRYQQDGASRCHVVCAADKVGGYYALTAGAVSHEQAPGNIRRNMPEPIPAIVLGRLMAHADWRGSGYWRGLHRDAVLRTLRLSQEMGIRTLLCHAIDAPP